MGYWLLADGPINDRVPYHQLPAASNLQLFCVAQKKAKKAGALFADFQNFGLQKRMALPAILLGEKSTPVHVTGVAFK
jgi:hypothetical protein